MKSSLYVEVSDPLLRDARSSEDLTLSTGGSIGKGFQIEMTYSRRLTVRLVCPLQAAQTHYLTTLTNEIIKNTYLMCHSELYMEFYDMFNKSEKKLLSLIHLSSL